MQWRGGRLEAVYNIKNNPKKQSQHHGDYRDGVAVLDRERGVQADITGEAWQIDTCIGNWFYEKGVTYKSPDMVIDMLADVVSKNGNLLLNIPVRADGSLDDEEVRICGEIGKWLSINGEAIYGTRPWIIYGEGPMRISEGSNFNEKKLAEFTARDIRFTTKGNTLYAIVLGWPEDGQVVIASLAEGLDPWFGKIGRVRMLGLDAPLKWSRDKNGLKVILPGGRIGDYACVLKINS